MQARWLDAGGALLVVAERGVDCVGAAYWITYKARAYYASGVYAGDNISHAIMWRSLLALKGLGVQFASLGWQGRATTDKERAIEFFKAGFGGRDVAVPIIETAYPLAKE